MEHVSRCPTAVSQTTEGQQQPVNHMALVTYIISFVFSTLYLEALQDLMLCCYILPRKCTAKWSCSSTVPDKHLVLKP